MVAALPVPVLSTFEVELTLALVVVGIPRIEVPRIDCGFADADAAKAAGVMTLVYVSAGSSDSVRTGEGNTVNAFPAVLDRACVPGSPDGRARGLYAVFPSYGKL